MRLPAAWNAGKKRDIFNSEFGMRNAEFGIFSNAEFGMRNSESGVRNAIFGVTDLH